MRYAIVIPDGAADLPCPELGGKTPLEAASTPSLDRLARDGMLLRVQTVPEGMLPGSDVANLSVLGYDPASCYTGRAPLEAAAMGLSLAPGEAVFRANTVTVKDNRMLDYAAGHITTTESHELITSLNQDLNIDGVRLYPGVSYRHLCVIEAIASDIPDCTPPHDILDQQINSYDPQGSYASWLLEVQRTSAELLPTYEVNMKRLADGKSPVTQLWLWGGGVMPALTSYKELYNLEGGIISAVDLLKGIANLAGLEPINVEGATGYYDTNYAGKAAAALACLEKNSFVAVHVEAPDEAGHNGDVIEKVRAIENIDREILAPLLDMADSAGDLRILCMPDHPTPIKKRTHTSEPVPAVIWGSGIEANGGIFTEAGVAELPVIPATALMGILLS